MTDVVTNVLRFVALQLQKSNDRKRSAALLTAARRLVAQQLGPGTRLQARGDIVRSATFRCSLEGAGPGVPASVFLKAGKPAQGRREFDPSDGNAQGSAYRLFNSWAGLRFLAGLCGEGGVSPRWVAGDRDLGFMLMEDAGETSVEEVLLGADAGAAERGLLDMARAVGRIHAASRGQRETYEAIRFALGPRGDEREVWGTGPWLRIMVDKLRANLENVGFTAEESFYAELAGTVRALGEPGPFLVYTHNDLCPDNVRLRAQGAVLIDFEHGGFRHAMTDGAYVRMLFPTCWRVNRVPPSVVSRMEDAYRAELVRGCPEAADDRTFRKALGHGCAYWLAVTLAFAFEKPGSRYDRTSALEKDQPWGLASLREIVLGRIEAFLESAEELDVYPRTYETCLRLKDHLARVWGPGDGVPLFPAFRGSADYAAATPLNAHSAV
ncbi:MAG TPA: phosphotransferase [Thermoanaerobaculia bacterium]|nr:phosphotransferase [Thermoanaerobaculia bacterium]